MTDIAAGARRTMEAQVPDVARREDLERFYTILDVLEEKCGGGRVLAECSGRMAWPRRGVYFVRENGELRRESGQGPRIVRVGTHALKTQAGTSLWTRLSQHRGRARSGTGNHRGSIFRLLVGRALIAQRGHEVPTWGQGQSAAAQVRVSELALEEEVSRVIGAMSVLWLDIPDEAGPGSLRGYVERNSIALLSNYGKAPLDPPSPGWLGFSCDRERVRLSGLWNSNHVDETHDADFLARFATIVSSAVHA